jgi:acyl carrier protein
VDLGVESLSLVAIFVELKRHLGTPEPADSEQYRSLHTPRLIATYVAEQAHITP